MKNLEHENHMETEESEKIKAFENQQETMQNIYKEGFASYAKKLPNLADAFDLNKHEPADGFCNCVCCMDERTPDGIHAAGSGILLSDKDFAEFFKKSGAESISSHTGCGAARIYCEKMCLPVEDSDRIGREWAEKKAGEMSVPYIHLEVAKPFHYARVCYYDGTGKFNYDGVKGLPAGFMVGRANMSKEASLAEVGVAKNIIFGHHGYGPDLLNKENPFLFVAVADTKEKMEVLKEELAKLVESFGEGVALDGFVAPK
jgi:hypothetical protein